MKTLITPIAFASLLKSLLFFMPFITNPVWSQKEVLITGEAIFVPISLEEAPDLSFSKFRLALGAGWSHQFYSVDKTQADDFEDFDRDLNDGINGDLLLSYFLSREIGVSVQASSFHSTAKSQKVTIPSADRNPMTIAISGDNTISYIGGAATYRYLSEAQNNSVIFNIGLGRFIFRENAKMVDSYELKGNCFAAVFGVGYDHYFNKTLGVGLNINYLSGTLTEAKLTSDDYSRTIQMSNGQPLNRLDISAGLRILF